MKNWKEDHLWARPLLAKVKQILGMVFFTEPPEEEDQERNTDLWILRLRRKFTDCRVAVRIRRFEQFMKPGYGNEFTIRSSRPSGAKTELQKMLDGWAQYFFYGFANKHATNFQKYTLADLHWITCWIKHYQVEHSELPGIEMPNPDGSSKFRVFTWGQIPNPNGSSYILKTWQADNSGNPLT